MTYFLHVHVQLSIFSTAVRIVHLMSISPCNRGTASEHPCRVGRKVGSAGRVGRKVDPACRG